MIHMQIYNFLPVNQLDNYNFLPVNLYAFMPLTTNKQSLADNFLAFTHLDSVLFSYLCL